MAKIRKLLSLLLCLVMVLSFFPAAYAEGENEGTITEEHDCGHDHEHEEETQGTIAPVEEEPVGAIHESPDTEPAEDSVGDGVLDVPETDETDEEHEGLVRVEFICDPEDTTITVYDPSQPDENGDPIVIEPEEDGTWLLSPGEYLYDAEREGVVPERNYLLVELNPSFIGVRVELVNYESIFQDGKINFSVEEAQIQGLSSSQIIQQIKSTYNSALSKSGRSSFNGYCGAYVNWQLVVLGINSYYVGADGNAEFDTYKNASQTSGGYPVNAYPASNYSLKSALNAITLNGSVDAYNILVGFEQGSGEAGRLNGHTCFIHAIIGGTVYFSESYSGTICGAYHAEGDPISCSIDAFCNYYGSRTVLDGVIHFGTTTPTYYLDLNGFLDGKSVSNLGEYGTADVFINDKLDESWVNDYYKQWPTGTNYEIRCRTNDGYLYNGVHSSGASASGTIGSSNVTVVLSYSTACSVTYKNSSGDITKTIPKGEYVVEANYDKLSNSYFMGWSYSPNTTMFDIRPGEMINVTGDVTLYPVYISQADVYSGQPVLVYNIADVDTTGYNVTTQNKTVTRTVTNSYWGDWSDWSTDAVSASDTVQVETTTLYRYYYFLCPNCGRHEPFWGTSDCGAQIPESAWHINWSTIPYSQCNYQTFSYTTAKYYTTSLGDGQLWCFSSGNLNHTTVGTKDAAGTDVVIKTGYRSRNLITETTTESATYTAYVLTVKTYTINYNANGGTGAPASQTKTHGTALTLSSTKPSRANASASSYTVTLNANGGSVNSTSLTAARTTSYSFKNWNTAANGSGTSYNAGASYTANAAATLYAQWNSSTSTAAVTLPTPARDGYDFVGWGTSTSATSGVTGSYTPTGNVTLYAVWSIKTYTISYDANGGTGAPAAQTKNHGTALTLSSTKPTRSSTSAGSYTVTLNANGGSVNSTSLTAARTTSYSFKNWNTKSDGSGTSYASGASYTANAAATLYAQWNSSTSTAAVTLPTPTRDGYNFVGWGTSATATSGVTGSYTPTGNVTLYAVWSIKTYTISYDANGGTGAPAAQTKTHGTALTLSSTKPTRANSSAGSYTVTLNANGGSVSSTSLTAARTTSYSFKNWNTAANGSGTSYNAGASYTANAVATLYAQWNSSTTTAAVTLPTPTREGYSFKGWATSAAATSGMTGSYTPSGDVTLYAIWEQSTAGSMEILSVTGHPGNEILVPIRLSSNPGLYTLNFHVNFDSKVMQFTGVENGSLTGWSFSQKSGYVHWETPDDTDKTGTGEIVKLRFQILENAADGEIIVSIDDLEAFNRAEKPVSFGLIPGTVTVSSRIAGDVNGDGEVSILDLVRFRKYLMHDTSDINASNADVTGDGSVNSQDLVRLRKYLAGDPYAVLD